MSKIIEELSEIMMKSNHTVDEVLDWMIKNKEDEFFKTNEGTNLNRHICEMGFNHAMIYADVSDIYLKEFNEKK